jgi:hypothetical protein
MVTIVVTVFVTVLSVLVTMYVTGVTPPYMRKGVLVTNTIPLE